MQEEEEVEGDAPSLLQAKFRNVTNLPDIYLCKNTARKCPNITILVSRSVSNGVTHDAGHGVGHEVGHRIHYGLSWGRS